MMNPLIQARTAFLLDLMELQAFVEAGKETSKYQELWIKTHNDYGNLQLQEFEELVAKAGMQ